MASQRLALPNQDLFYQWRQFLLTYAVEINGVSHAATISNVQVDGQAVIAYEVSWGDSTPIGFSATTHTYPSVPEEYLISVLALQDGVEIEGSTLVQKSPTTTTFNVSVNRFAQVALIRKMAFDGSMQWFDAETLAPVTPSPPTEVLRTTPIERERERTVFSQVYRHLEGGLSLHQGISHLQIHNLTGTLTLNGQPIPVGSTLSLPSLGDHASYPRMELNYSTTSGDTYIWTWRKSL